MKKLKLNLDELKVETFKVKEGNKSSNGSIIGYFTGQDDCPSRNPACIDFTFSCECNSAPGVTCMPHQC